MQAIDADGNTAAATVNVTFKPNHLPTAVAGGPYRGIAQAPVQFDGSKSSDPDSDPLNYLWAFGDSSTSTDPMPAHAYGAPGTFTVRLTVSDDVGSINSVDTVATIDPDRTAPYVTVHAPSQALAGDVVKIVAQANDDVTVTRVTLLVNGGDPIELTAAPYERSLTISADAAVGARFTFKATAQDPAGNVGSGEATLVVAAT